VLALHGCCEPVSSLGEHDPGDCAFGTAVIGGAFAKKPQRFNPDRLWNRGYGDGCTRVSRPERCSR